MLLKIGDESFYTDSPLVDDIKPLFKAESGEWVLDTSKLDGNMYKVVDRIAKVIGVEPDIVLRAVENAVEKHKEEEEAKLEDRLKKLLEAGVFAVAPTTKKVPETTLFKKRGDLYYLDRDELAKAILKNRIKDGKRLVWLVESAMNSANFRFFDFHIRWLEANAKALIDDAVNQYYNRNTIALLDTGEDIELVFGRRLTSKELTILREAFTTKYYIQDSHMKLIERRLRVIKYDRERGRYRIPYFAVPHLIRVAKKLGFKKIVNKVDWVKKSIPEPPKIDIRLYRFQAQALNAWLDAGCRGVVVIPTGGGKTFVGLIALSYLSVPTLICVPTIELARQWIQRIEELLGIKDVGLLGGGKHEIRDITVAIYNSAVKYLDELKNRFDLFIADESHHIPAKVFKEVAFGLKARKRLALSATPYRNDKNEALLFFTMGRIVYIANYNEMVRLKLASPLKFYRVYVRLTPEEEAEYARVNSNLDNSNPAKIQKLMKIAFKAERKYDTLRKIVQELPEDKILVFCHYVEQAKKAYRVLRGVVKNEVALLTGSTRSELRKKYFEEFKEGRKRIIVTTTVLDEGIDVPDAETAIILSGSGTERQMIQRIGRVIRYRPNKTAKVIEVIAKNTVEEKIADRRAKVLKEYGIKLSK
mgnify:CR=1 FL=1